jgi:hypothetical protein
MLIGEKHERIVVDGEDLLRPYAIRPAVRPVVRFDVFPGWVRLVAALAVVPVAILVLAFCVHALMPTVQ